MKATRYSSVATLLRVTAYVLRFVHNVRCRLTKSTPTTGELTTEETSVAERKWIKELQVLMKRSEKFKQTKLSLHLYEDEDGILRCRGRIDNAPLPHDSKFPILLPADHHLTNLVILRCHDDVMHNGLQETLAQVRTRFWIPRGRQVVKRALVKCTVCNRAEGKSYGTPPAPPLPDYRLSDDFAFTKIGVDYAGPLFVRDIHLRTDEMKKVFIALYTCASSREIHLDLVPDEDLLTVLIQIEGVMNSRPLTYLCEEGGEPLTPSHLIIGRRLLSPPSNVPVGDVTV